MSFETIKKLIIVSNVYFWGTEEIDEVSKFWYVLFLSAVFISFLFLITVYLF